MGCVGSKRRITASARAEIDKEMNRVGALNLQNSSTYGRKRMRFLYQGMLSIANFSNKPYTFAL